MSSSADVTPSVYIIPVKHEDTADNELISYKTHFGKSDHGSLYPQLQAEYSTERSTSELVQRSTSESSDSSLGSLSDEERKAFERTKLRGTLTQGFNKLEHLITSEVHKVNDVFNKPPVMDEYTRWSDFWNLLNIVMFLADYTSDIVVAVMLSKEDDSYGNENYLIFTCLFIVIPLYIVNLFSIVWYHQDKLEHPGGFCARRKPFNPRQKTVLIVGHLLGLGPVIRTVHIMICGRREKQKGTITVDGPYCPAPIEPQDHCSPQELLLKRKYYERDSAYLNLIDAFSQDCPQLILQLYILLTRHGHDLDNQKDGLYTSLFQLSSVTLALISTSMALVNFAQASRWADTTKVKLSLSASIIQGLWRFFMILGRMLTFCMFLTVYPTQFFMFFSGHYAVMLVWTLAMRTNFCGELDGKSHPTSEFVYNMVMAWILCFDMFHVSAGPTRLKGFLYYTLVAAEHAVLISFWFLYVSTDPNSSPLDSVPWNHQGWYQDITLATVPACFVLGLIFLILYYTKFHPDGKMPNTKEKTTFKELLL